MSVYIWGISENYPQKAVACYEHEKCPDYIKFIQGEIIDPPTTLLEFEVETPLSTLKRFDHICNDIHVPIVGEKLQNLFNEYCPDDIQYVDTLIHYPGGSTTEYKVVNIACRVVSVDHNHSIYDFVYGTQDILGFKKLTLLTDCLGNHNLARMQEYEPKILVSAKIAALFTQYEIKGVELETPQESTGYIDQAEL